MRNRTPHIAAVIQEILRYLLEIIRKMRERTTHNASVVHTRQRSIQEAIRKTELELERVTELRANVGSLKILTGLFCLLGLPILMLLNAVQDAPVLEYLLGISAGEPWDTPLGQLQPLAILASIAFVIAMGLAALLALGNEPSAENEGKSPRDARQMLRGFMATVVMLLLVAVIGYGSYMRGMLINPDEAVGGHNARVSCMLSVALALVQEIAVVGVVVCYLVPTCPVKIEQRKLKHLRKTYDKIQNEAFIHEAVGEAEKSVAELMDTKEEIEKKCDSARSKLRLVQGVSLPNTHDLDGFIKAYEEREHILTTANDGIVKVEKMIGRELLTAESYREAGRGDIEHRIAVHQAVMEHAKKTLVQPVKEARGRYDAQNQAGRSRTARWESAGLDQIVDLGANMPEILRQLDQMKEKRLALLESLFSELSSEQFKHDYSELSQNKTLTHLGELLVRLDGGAKTEQEDTNTPIQQRIQATLEDLQQRISALPPATCFLVKLGASLSEVGKMRQEAFDRLSLTTHPQIVVEIDKVYTLETEATQLLSGLEARIQKVVKGMEAEEKHLLKIKRERELEMEREKSWFRRLWHKIFPNERSADIRPISAIETADL